jgi:hypothetical protein
MSGKEEKRDLQRFNLHLPATIYPAGRQTEKDVITAPTINICAGGVLLKTGDKLAVGSEVEVKIVLNLDELEKIQDKKAQIKLSGIVLRTDNEGTAIAFDEKYEIEPLE